MSSRSLVFFAMIAFLFLVSGQLLMGRQGLLLGFLIASAFNFYIYFLSEKRILVFFQTERTIGQDIWGIQDCLSKISKILRTQPPQIYISSFSEPFVFTMSRGWGQTKIILTESLLKELNKQEVEDLLTLQLHYSTSNTSLFLGFRTLLCEIFFILAQFFDFILNLPFYFSKNSERVTFFQKVFLPFAFLLQQSFQKDLMKADEYVAQLIGSKERLARLLWKLNSLNHNTPLQAPPSCAIAYAVNPLTYEGINSYFQRHAPLEVRIQNLIGSKTI